MIKESIGVQDLRILAFFRLCRQQTHTDPATLNFWNGYTQWTPWQSARSCARGAGGRLEFCTWLALVHESLTALHVMS